MEAVVNLVNVFNIEASRLSVSLSLFFIFLGLLYWYSVYPFSVLSRCGIKHPKPVPFFGNLFMFRQGFLDATTDLIKKHGRVCGYYLARRPVVVVADPDILKEVMIKNFKSFPNRMNHGLERKPLSDCLIVLKNERWKRVRSIVTPTFSAAKMKEMVPLINTAADALMKNLNVLTESGEAFDIHRCFGYFTMDVIASVAFGTQLDSQNNPDDPFIHHVQMFLCFSFFRPIMLFFMVLPSFLTPLMKLIPNKGDQINQFFINSIQKIIKQRKEQRPEQRRRDFLQLILDAQTSKESVSLDNFDTANHSEINHRTQPSTSVQDNSHPHLQEPPIRHSKKNMLTEDEIVGQAFIFLLAGHETASSTLAFTCYLLAIHPECQRKVQEEVDDFFTRHSSPDYTNVQELKYLDMVLSETLRLYPPGFRFGRDIDQDCMVNGQLLPKGAVLEIPAGFLHYDPEHWPEPERFIPERFTPDVTASRHPFVYLPFGAGPRNCVGMRFAQLEIKMTLIHLFHRFSIMSCSKTKVPLELKSSRHLVPKDGVFVKIQRRDLGESRMNSPSDN